MNHDLVYQNSVDNVPPLFSVVIPQRPTIAWAVRLLENFLAESNTAYYRVRPRRHEKELCPVCQEAIDGLDEGFAMTQCGHLYHAACFAFLTRRHEDCALCRAKIAEIPEGERYMTRDDLKELREQIMLEDHYQRFRSSVTPSIVDLRESDSEPDQRRTLSPGPYEIRVRDGRIVYPPPEMVAGRAVLQSPTVTTPTSSIESSPSPRATTPPRMNHRDSWRADLKFAISASRALIDTFGAQEDDTPPQSGIVQMIYNAIRTERHSRIANTEALVRWRIAGRKILEEDQLSHGRSPRARRWATAARIGAAFPPNEDVRKLFNKARKIATALNSAPLELMNNLMTTTPTVIERLTWSEVEEFASEVDQMME